MHEVFRGKTDVYISFETFSAADVEVKLNEALAAAYIEKLKLIEEKFGKEVELIIDGGIGGIEPSTIVNCTNGEAEIVRQGKGILNDF